jgi:8-oxo-dGTP pyrophosphatase MutT (NUDIX family)
LREAVEETGIDGLRVVEPAVDLDVHMVEPPADGDTHQRTNSHGYGYGMRLA